MTAAVLVRFVSHSLTVEVPTDQAALLEQLLRDARKDPASRAAADKLQASLASKEREITLTDAEHTSLVTVLALSLADLEEPLRRVYLRLRDESRGDLP